ncbi:MAG: enoyl-CoA hydratase/isomerase family protein [Chloroflexota bacterium]|nr:enoyl-CoA hydratase/isomerase family protein [Chloroflexota bacterium]
METLLVERDAELPGLVTITLNRPDKLNAIDVTMHDELQRVCLDLHDDFDTRVIILTGAGRAFSSGADLKSVREGHPGSDLDRRYRVSAGDRTCSLLEGLDQVTIGAINGFAIGGAVVFATCMDLRLAAESAWFSIPEVDIELPLTWGALPRLMRELGPARTKELVMLCDRFSSAEALRWGFVNRVYPDDQVVLEARKMAARLLAKDPMALAMTKSATNAMAQLMVPGQASHAEREQMLLAYLLRGRRQKQ